MHPSQTRTHLLPRPSRFLRAVSLALVPIHFLTMSPVLLYAQSGAAPLTILPSAPPSAPLAPGPEPELLRAQEEMLLASLPKEPKIMAIPAPVPPR